jgi:hypothetical protein
MRLLITILGTGMLVLSSVTVSDARQQKRLNTSQSEAVYGRSDSDTARDRDSSCFTSVPAMYGCSANGG